MLVCLLPVLIVAVSFADADQERKIRKSNWYLYVIFKIITSSTENTKTYMITHFVNKSLLFPHFFQIYIRDTLRNSFSKFSTITRTLKKKSNNQKTFQIVKNIFFKSRFYKCMLLGLYISECLFQKFSFDICFLKTF